MPKFKITGPDGNSYFVTAPEGATEQDALEHLQSTLPSQERTLPGAHYGIDKSQYKQNPSDNFETSLQFGPLDTGIPLTGAGAAGIAGAGKTLDRIGKGFEQGYYALTGNQSAADQLKQQVIEENNAYNFLSDKYPIATTIGETMPSMVVPSGSGYKAMMAAGALPGILEYGTPEERVIRSVSGAAGSAMGRFGADVLGRVNKPFRGEVSPALQKSLDVFEREGIPLSAANKAGSQSLKWVDSALDNLPWAADMQFAAKTKQREAFNNAVSKTFGENSTELTPDVLKLARDRLGQGFEDLSSRNKLNFTNQTLNDLTNIKFNAQRYDTGKNETIVNNYIDDLLAKVEPDSTISGQAYRKFDSALGKRIRGTSDGDLRTLLGDVRETVRTAMDDSISQADAQAWKDLRNQYANLQMTADVAKNSPNGNISPAALLQRANQQSPSAKFNGGGQLGELGRAGKNILTSLPDSGTAQRAQWMRILGEGSLGLGALGGLLSPVTALTLAAGAGVPIAMQKSLWGNGIGQRYLTKGLLNVSPETEQILRKLGHSAGVSGSTGLLNQMGF